MTLPVPITLSLYCCHGAVTPGTNNRDCVIGTGSVICFLYHPCLVSLSIPICPLSQNSQDFSFTCIKYGMDMVPSIIDVWGYDREFCSSSSPSSRPD